MQKEKKIKIYIVGGNYHYASWVNGKLLVENPKEADIILFTGGEDVHPSFYKELIGKYTSSNIKRDIVEFEIFKEYPHKLKLGICRGAQFLCVASGGKLIQHVNNHGLMNGHYIKDDETSREYFIPSTHHQMLNPSDVNHILIAGASKNLSTTYLNGDNEEINLPKDFKEPEIVYFPDTNSLAIQGHPEMSDNKSLHDYLNNLLLKYLTKQLIEV